MDRADEGGVGRANKGEVGGTDESKMGEVNEGRMDGTNKSRASGIDIKAGKKASAGAIASTDNSADGGGKVTD